MEQLEQYGVAGILVLLILREVLPHVKSKNGKSEYPRACEAARHDLSIARIGDVLERLVEIAESTATDARSIEVSQRQVNEYISREIRIAVAGEMESIRREIRDARSKQ